MRSRGISSFSGPSFHFASALGRASQSNLATHAKGGDEDALAHMHLDSLSLSSTASQSAAVSAQTAVSSSPSDEGEADATSEGDSEGAEGGYSDGGVPSFLLSDGTPGIEGMGEGDDGGDGDAGDGD